MQMKTFMTRFLLICSFLQKQMKILLYVSLFETRFLWCLFLIELCQSQHIYKVLLCVTGNVSSMRLLHSFKICVFDTFCFLSLLAYLQLLKLSLVTTTENNKFRNKVNSLVHKHKSKFYRDKTN